MPHRLPVCVGRLALADRALVTLCEVVHNHPLELPSSSAAREAVVDTVDFSDAIIHYIEDVALLGFPIDSIIHSVRQMTGKAALTSAADKKVTLSVPCTLKTEHVSLERSAAYDAGCTLHGS
jgi:hypothetical protein